MQLNDLRDLLVEELKDLYSAEKQILSARTKVARSIQKTRSCWKRMRSRKFWMRA